MPRAQKQAAVSDDVRRITGVANKRAFYKLRLVEPGETVHYDLREGARIPAWLDAEVDAGSATQSGDEGAEFE